VTLGVLGNVLNANAVALLPGGKLVIAGQRRQVIRRRPVTCRRSSLSTGLTDGSTVHSGAAECSSRISLTRGPFDATAVAANRSGRVRVAGGYGQGSMLLMRLTPAGRLDRGLGPKRAGYATRAVGSIASSMTLTRDGTILLGGSNANVIGRPMVIAGGRRRRRVRAR
jgi:hypothetical protein